MKEEICKMPSPGLLHLFNGDPSFRRDVHNFGGNAQRLVGVEEGHPRVIHSIIP